MWLPKSLSSYIKQRTNYFCILCMLVAKNSRLLSIKTTPRVPKGTWSSHVPWKKIKRVQNIYMYTKNTLENKLVKNCIFCYAVITHMWFLNFVLIKIKIINSILQSLWPISIIHIKLNLSTIMWDISDTEHSHYYRMFHRTSLVISTCFMI